MRLKTLLTCAVLIPLVLSPESLEAQEYPDDFDDGIPLYEHGLGPFSRAVTTTSPRAQEFVDQGFQFMYAFTPEDAARSFREAQKLDPSCAMCYWGEAWAWGPYLNGPMGADDAPRAHAAIQKAMELADGASPVERAMIEALATRYAPTHDPQDRRRLDEVYSAAMAELWAAHPTDLDIGTHYGESLMLLQPRRGTWDIETPEVMKIHQVLEEVLALDIQHPGACHLYIHATESTTRPDKAEACADFLGNSIPGASHINHMPSHTYNEVGRWADGVRANLQAWHSDQKAAVGEGFAIYPSHNLHMLLFAASMDGQGAIAIQAGKDYGKLVRGGVFYHVLTLLRFGRFDEILPLVEEPGNTVEKGLWAFGRGYAHLRMGAADSAAVYLERVRELAGQQGAFRGHSAADLLGVTGGILEGEMLLADGRSEQAIAVLTEAVETEDGLRYDEPEPLNFSARDWLGAALLSVGSLTEAEAVYREALVDHPHNGWALFGLRESLLAQGEQQEAAAVDVEFQAAWARSDTWIRGSRF